MRFDLITSVTYAPEDEWLPSVTVSLEVEMYHWAEMLVAVTAAAVVFKPDLVAAATAGAGLWNDSIADCDAECLSNKRGAYL